MKLAIVVQRYGADINGGAELHARYIAEHLAPHVDVEVLTTCARDYVSWRNELTPGVETVNGVSVRRFPVSRERVPEDFGRRSARVFDHRHSWAQEMSWLASEGPCSPALISYLKASRNAYDYFIFFSYRYYHSFHGVRAVPERAILVPTAERDPAIGLGMFGPVFRGVRAIMYNSLEERAMIQHVAGNGDVPEVVVGVGSEVPTSTEPSRFRRKFGIEGRYLIYVGRIDVNKGCGELFTYFQHYATLSHHGFSLVLIGNSLLPIPDHPRIRHLGFLEDEDKFDGVAGADALIMPSYFESLSMVALEAWGLGRPVVANGRCDVLKGQCVRSNAGLYYESFEEFLGILRLLGRDRRLGEALGQNGRQYFARHYTWPVVERKYLDMLERLTRENAGSHPARGIESGPGLFQRWRRALPASRSVVEQVPGGAITLSRRRPPAGRPAGTRRLRRTSHGR